ncbi:MAG TPA: homocysteine S-methyltransferase family protein [Aeromicrobium sp.]|nr:homocysteine S-methyltransferase family protein [Aeromicrobium sp.]
MDATTALAQGSWVTDGGLETDLVFNHGVDLPEFASFPLLADTDGRRLLADYYAEYATVARNADAGLVLETPTWRANPDWAGILGHDRAALDGMNRAAVEFMQEQALRSELTNVLISGVVGPRGDGYLADDVDSDEAAAYHRDQVASFGSAGADLVHAMTMTTAAEGIGVVRAAREAGLPVAISFTVETDGRLPDGATLAASVARVEQEAPADWYGINCAHPTHVAAALDGGAWQERLVFLRPNASTLSHEELDAMEVLDSGDLDLLTSSGTDVRKQVPSVRVVGGCCGTDSRHVAALWGVSPTHL